MAKCAGIARMIRVVFVCFLCLIAYQVVTAQTAKSFYSSSYKSRNSGSYGRNTGLVTFSYGFPNLPVSGYNYRGDNRIGFGPAYAKYEHAIIDEVGIGVQTALSVGRYEYNSNQHERIRSIHFALLGYYHFNKLIPVRQLDVYAGAGLAYRNRQISYSDNTYFSDSDGTVRITAKVGIRYYLKTKVALYAEAGYDDMSDINLGVSFRFR